MWLILIITGLFLYLIYKLNSSNYWDKYGVSTTKAISSFSSVPIFFGKKIAPDLDEIIYKSLGKSKKFTGFIELGQPTLLVKDIEIIKKLLIKDFDYFMDRKGFATGSDRQEILNRALFNMKGEEWKGVRHALSPTFTTGKIRRMMSIFNGVSKDWVAHLKETLNGSGGTSASVNLEKEVVNFTVEALSASVFGMNSGTIKNPRSDFAVNVHKLNDSGFLVILIFMIGRAFPKLLKWFQMDIVDHKALTYFEEVLRQGMKIRREGGEVRNDFLQLLIEASKGQAKALGSDELDKFEEEAKIKGFKEEKKNYLTDEVIDGTMVQFFFAGFGTTANFIGFTLYTLAIHQEVQNKLRKELQTLFGVEGKEEIDYDELNNLVYLDMVVCEVLRKFPGLGRIERECVKDYNDPSESLKIPQGAVVAIPVQAIHNDPEHYEHPDKFYPEHFSPEKKAARSPYAFLSFGSGPRNCIGMRFALVEGKAAIAHIIHNFILEPTSKTPVPVYGKPAGLALQLPDDLEISIRLAK